MNDKIVVRRLAEAELDEARAWYELQVTGLGGEFLDEFEKSAAEIAAGPLRWPLYHRTVRRFVMSRFPYVIYFELKGDLIRILRVVHNSKDPGPVKELFD